MMKSYEVLDIEDNLVEAYLTDTIGRNVELNSFVELLTRIDDNMSISIDGKWGSGKTFFVKQTQLIIDSHNPTAAMYDSEHGKQIRKQWENYHKNTEEVFPAIVTVYYDAWSHDNDDDPLLSIIYEIMRSASWGINPQNKKDWVEILAAVSDCIFDRGIADLLKTVKGEDLFGKIKTQREVQEIISNYFESLLPEHGNSLVVFVDELDRCSPQYAVKLLERIKHYLNLPNVIFVFSINPEELQHTIKKNYGDEFSAGRYLDRFFDLRVSIPPANMDKFIFSLGIGERRNLRESICKEVIRMMGFELREISRYLPLAKHAAYKSTDSDHNQDRYIWADDNGMSEFICLSVILPIALGLKIYDSDEFTKFVEGKDGHWFFDVINNDEHKDWVGRFMLADDESYGDIEGKTHVDYKNRVNDVYNAVFVRKYDNCNYQHKIGQAIFTADSKRSILQAAGLLSKYTVYDI